MADYFDFIKKQAPNTSTNGVTPSPAGPVAPNQIKDSSTSLGMTNKMVGDDKKTTTDPSNVIANPVNDEMKQSQSNNRIASSSRRDVGTPRNDSGVKQQTTNNLDLMTHLTQRSNRVMMASQTKAKELKSDIIDSEHLLAGLLSDTEIFNLFTELKIQPQLIFDELNKIYRRGTVDKKIDFSPRIKKIINDGLIIARKLNFEFISPEHLLLSLYEEGEGAGARILAKMGLKKEDLNKQIIGKKEGLEIEDGQAKKKKKALESFTIDLTAKASQGLLDAVVERSDVIERVIHILSRRTKNNPSLVGEAGVGKTAIVEGLAQKIVAKEVPESLLNKKILQLDLMNVLAGASHRGDFEERMKDLLEELKNSQGKIILFIDEIHNIVGAGSSGEGSLDASNFLKPALARGELQMIGATTLIEYRKYIEKDPALERRFQPVLVSEPTEEAAIKMLIAIKDKYEAFHKVQIPIPIIEEAVRLSKRYIGDRFLPDKAVDLIDEAASAVRLPLISLPEEIKSEEVRIAQLTQEAAEQEKKGDKVKLRITRSKIDEIASDLKEKKDRYNLKKSQTTGVVTVEIIKDVIARWTGIPVSKISSSEVEKLAHLEEIIHKRLINQEGAVTSVSQAIRRGRAGLKSAGKPTGSFIFLGPTGVGKTELAKTLADIIFGSEEAMIRFDMTEYMEKHEVAKLLGAPPGYVGYEEGGKLTESVRRRPYSVVLFDEVEKAHPDIFNILLQILDDGRLTDNRGHVVSFKNTIIICTSNIGSRMIQEEMLKDKSKIQNPKSQINPKSKINPKKPNNNFEEIKKKVMEELGRFFKPELINRFDEVIVFEPLKISHMILIVNLQLKGVSRLLDDQTIGFGYTDEVVAEIVRAGFDPIYGARPLKRSIQKLIENPISNLIIKGNVSAGDLIKVRLDNDKFVFDIEKTELVNTKMEKFHCSACGYEFLNEKILNYTIFCPKCLAKKEKIQKL